jgi:hypothetical protein
MSVMEENIKNTSNTFKPSRNSLRSASKLKVRLLLVARTDLDFLCDDINQGHQKKGCEFELCQLKPDKFKAGNIHHSDPGFVKVL